MLENRLIAQEMMDEPGMDLATYRAVLQDLAKVNRTTKAYAPTLSYLERALADHQSFRLLDVGFGDGDMLREIAAWAERKGKTAYLVGVDLNPKSKQVARESTPSDLPIEYWTGDYAEVIARDFDLVISSLVAHHMSHDELVAFLVAMDRHAKRGWFINDLHRHVLAYNAYSLLAQLAGWHPIVRHDGHLSIARSYRPAEWKPMLKEAGVTDARVRRVFPFRLCVEKRL
ncbi:methyltransferase domain-containing protein [Qipengyuania sp. DY56-A-20]|jgi:2-polyprenyl-3-methyl-5-hydroxy-6-metoxy-1,4-benzoquinol methylase|uniref:Methyltransferase domain-containing protein n=1 Tax=Qipengyuania benthica TaxID=3067651 RepID=A0ABT9H8F3_9SPHN|nr:methyltransferase domain-containing protein [Qipengyuania sp. DY56-A-20]MDP4539155.1 methyltransferase domain-containing protein [Qipengyuania sp. DY56-A-20]